MSNNRKAVAVLVEGEEFKSMQDAANFLGVKSVNVWRAAHTNGDIKGFSIKLKDPSASQAKSLSPTYAMEYYKKKHANKKRGEAKSCPVYCENLNKTFRTIGDAAKFAKVSGYTLSTKTETCGKFIDKAGNVYTRLKPMQQRTSKVYPDTGAKVKVERPQGYTRMVTPKTTTPESKPVVIDNNPVTVLQNNAISHIKNGDYASAEKFITALKVISNN